MAPSLNRLRLHTLKKALHWGAFFVSAVLLLSSRWVWAQCPVLPGGSVAEVAHVYDGDTVRLTDGRRVRLIGIDTPELGRDGKADQSGAREAEQWLEQRLKGERIYLVQGREKQDRYGRLLAHVYWRERLVSEQMLQQGLGFALAIGANTRLVECLFRAESAARADVTGVWRQSPRLATGINRAGFAVVSGRVSRITQTRKGDYIDLDDHIALFFPVGLKDVSSHLQTGDEIEARGWVQDRLLRRSSLTRGQQRWVIRMTAGQHLQAD